MCSTDPERFIDSFLRPLSRRMPTRGSSRAPHNSPHLIWFTHFYEFESMIDDTISNPQHWRSFQELCEMTNDFNLERNGRSAVFADWDLQSGPRESDFETPSDLPRTAEEREREYKRFANTESRRKSERAMAIFRSVHCHFSDACD